MTSTRAQFGRAVRRLRKERGYNSGVRFATAAKMDRAHLTNVEAGRSDIGIDLIARIAATLGLTLIELFTAVEQESANESAPPVLQELDETSPHPGP